ncbi:unnamed protein product, partial [Closterium sp. Naga37s-1]
MALALRSPCRTASTCIFLLATALFSSSDHFTQLSAADAAVDSAEGGGGGGGGAAAISLPESLSSYSNVALLDPRLELHWTVNDSDATIRLAVRANTAGWLAIGISEIGSMVGSDVLVAWVAEKEGRVYATDCFIFNTSTEPTLDSNQDWHVLGGSQTTNQSTGDTWTTVHAWRRLDTGDCNDRPIISGKLHNIIWATGPTDDVSYHGSTRGGAALVLAPAPGPTILEPSQPPSTASAAAVFKSIRGSGRLAVQQKAVGEEETDARVLEFTVKDYPVIDAPLESKKHAVEWGPVINTTHISSLHHAFLYGCSSTFVAVWAWGGRPFTFPPYIGYPIGPGYFTKFVLEVGAVRSSAVLCNAVGFSAFPHDFPRYQHCWPFPPLPPLPSLSLPPPPPLPLPSPSRPPPLPSTRIPQMHYANPEGRSDMIDSSGVYLKLAASPGFKDAHIMKVGMVDHTRLIRIPPAMPSWTHSNSCPGECTAAVFKNESVKIIGSILHEHNIGRQEVKGEASGGRRQVKRHVGGFSDYASQQTMPVQPEFELLPGDEIRTTCVWDSTSRFDVRIVTVGGPAAENEMCVAYLVYYTATQGRDMHACYTVCGAMDSGTLSLDPSRRDLSTHYV